MLNILRPSILRQYYGVNKSLSCSDIISGYTCGYESIRNNVGIDPKKFMTKLFDNNMYNVALYLKMLIFIKATLLELYNLNLTNDHDSCTVLRYFPHKDVRIAEKMGFHCDNTYSLNGIYSKCGNCQLEKLLLLYSLLESQGLCIFKKLY